MNSVLITAIICVTLVAIMYITKDDKGGKEK